VSSTIVSRLIHRFRCGKGGKKRKHKDVVHWSIDLIK